MKGFRSIIWQEKSDRSFLAVLSVVLGIGTLAFGYESRFHIADFDGIANLNMSRFMSESLTPGLSQVGTWNMLNHIILAPLTAFQFWYWTGLAGFVFHLPLLFLTTWFIYKLCIEITGSRYASIVAAVVFVFNPYVLQITVSPMSEPPFFTFLAATAAFLVRWINRQSIFDLFISAICIALASIARFEGFALLPFAFVAVFVTTIKERYSWSKSFSTILLFLSLALLGPVFVVGYSWYYTGNPVYFITYTSVSPNVTSTIESSVSDTSTIESLTMSLRHAWEIRRKTIMPAFIGAAFFLFSPVAIFTAIAGIFAIISVRKKWALFVAIFILLAPTAFIFLAYAVGKRYIAIPPISPRFINARFLLQMGVAISFLVSCAIAAPLGARYRFVRWIGKIIGVVAIAGAVIFCFQIFFISNFPVVRNNVSYSGKYLKTANLRDYYDHGYVLISHSYNETYIFNSFLPLDHIIYESNFRYYGQTMNEPWLFARWIVLHKNMRKFASRDFFSGVSRDIFDHYYELVLSDSDHEIYRIREEIVRHAVMDLGYDPSLVPSINPSAKWDPVTFYETLSASKRL